MRKAQKEKIVNELKQQLTENNNLYLIDFRGMTVSQANELRKKVKESNSYFKVVKNRLVLRVLEGSDNKLRNLLSGPTAIAFTEEDPVRLAKVLVDFAKENKILEIKGGLLKGEFVEENRVKEIANLPPREELLAKFAYFMAFPLTKMLRLFQSPLSNFGLLVSQLKDKK